MKNLTASLFLLIFFLPLGSFAQENAQLTDKVIVTVNGVTITVNDIRHFLSKQTKEITPDDAIRELINVELINQAAKNEKLLEDPQVQREVRRTTSAMIASLYIQNHLRTLEITDEQLEARYKKEYVDAGNAAEYNANHILVKTDKEAKDIIRQLDEGGNFEELAKTLSTGPSGKSGGALGWFKKGDMVAPFSQATMKLEKGQYSKDPVQTQFGWHVILLNDMRSDEPPALDSVRKELNTAIASDSLKDMLRVLHESATIEFAQN